MKKITRVFTVFIVITILSACSEVKVHEDVDEELAKDILKFVDTIMKNYDKDIKRDDVSKKDEGIIADYYEKYMEDADPLAYEDEEANKNIVVNSMFLYIGYMDYIEIQEDDIMLRMVKTIEWHVENGNEEEPIY